MTEFAYFILGALIGLLGSYFFYYQAGQDLRREAEKLRLESEKLRKLQELTLYVVTNPQAKTEPTRDEAGNIVGISVSAAELAAGRSSARGELTVTPKDLT